MNIQACEGETTMATTTLNASDNDATSPCSKIKRDLTEGELQDEIDALNAIYGMDYSGEDFTESCTEAYFETAKVMTTERRLSHPTPIAEETTPTRTATDVANEVCFGRVVAAANNKPHHRTTQRKDRVSRLIKKVNAFNNSKKDITSQQSLITLVAKSRRHPSKEEEKTTSQKQLQNDEDLHQSAEEVAKQLLMGAARSLSSCSNTATDMSCSVQRDFSVEEERILDEEREALFLIHGMDFHGDQPDLLIRRSSTSMITSHKGTAGDDDDENQQFSTAPRSQSLFDQKDLARCMNQNLKISNKPEVFDDENVLVSAEQQAAQAKQSFFRRSQFQQAMDGEDADKPLMSE